MDTKESRQELTTGDMLREFLLYVKRSVTIEMQLQHLHDMAHTNRQQLTELCSKVDLLLGKVDKLMALSQESKDLLARIDKATSDLAARIQALLDKPNATEAEFRSLLTPIVSTLEAMGHDPNNPIPVP